MEMSILKKAKAKWDISLHRIRNQLGERHRELEVRKALVPAISILMEAMVDVVKAVNDHEKMIDKLNLENDKLKKECAIKLTPYSHHTK